MYLCVHVWSYEVLEEARRHQTPGIGDPGSYEMPDVGTKLRSSAGAVSTLSL